MKKTYIRYQLAAAALSIFAIAQANIMGTVQTAEGEPIPGASVVILALPDTTIVNAAMADADGHFYFPDEKAERKLLKASCIGFESITLEPREGENIISLAPNSTELAEVSVTSEKGTLRAEAGKFIYVPGSMALKMANALEALKIAPMLDYNMQTDAFSILTKGASKIYINGRDPKEFPEEIMAMLRTVSPKNIKRVEIITNPGAIVEGSYKGGIINIEMTLPNEGLIGSVNTRIGSSFHSWPNTNSSLYLGYHKNKFHYSMNLAYNQGSGRSHQSADYLYGDSDTEIRQRNRSSSHFNSLLLNFNAYYNLTAKSKLGLSAQTYTYEGYDKTKIKSTVITPEGEQTSISTYRNVVPVKTPEAKVSAYYTLNLDNRNSYFDVNGFFARVLTKSFTDRNFPGSITRDDNADRFRHWNINTTLRKNFADNSSLQSGFFFHNYRMANRKNYSPSELYKDYRVMKNTVYLYSQYSRVINPYISFTAGLRWEYNHFNIRLQPGMDTYKNIYQDLLPSASVGLRLPNGKHQWSLEYSRYVQNPGVYDLDPTVVYSTPNTASSGNPHLKSYTSDYFAIQYLLFGHFTFTPNLTNGKNYFRNPVVEGDVTITRPMIDGRMNFLGLPLMYDNTFFRIWNVRVFVTPQWTHVKSNNDPELGYSQWICSAMTRQQIQFIPGKPYFLTLEYSIMPKHRAGSKSYQEAHHNLNLSFQGQPTPHLQIFGGVYNLLNSRPKSYYNSQEYSYSTKNTMSALSIMVGFNYWFGNSKVEAADNRLPNL